MRVMGVECNVGLGDDIGEIWINVVENKNEEKEVIYVHYEYISINIEQLAINIANTFKTLKCDYISINTNGVSTKLIEELENTLESNKIKCKLMNNFLINEMIQRLNKDNLLSKVGLELKTVEKVNGNISLLYDNYSSYEASMIHSIGFANMILDEQTLDNEKEELIKKLEEAKETVNKLSNILEDVRFK